MAEKSKEFDISSKMASILGGVSNMNTGAEHRPQLEYIDIDLIDPDPNNRKELQNIEALARNILLVGLRQPLGVRKNPDAPGRYVAESGHRRRMAIKYLVDAGEEKFRLVPCMVAEEGDSPAMSRLKLLSGNIVTQTLTSAEMAEATKDFEDCIYELKEEGHEFPGKVRDYVAQMFNVASSRLAKLKVIREKLGNEYMPFFENGKLSEVAAYRIAKEDADVQIQLWEHYIRSTAEMGLIGNFTEWQIDNAIKKIKAITERKCKHMVPSEGCNHCAAMLTKAFLPGYAPCEYYCCANCPELRKCKEACPRMAEKALKMKAAAKEKRATELAEEKQQAKDRAQVISELWKRFGEARAAAGKSVEDCLAAMKVQWPSISNEYYPDYESGKKEITEKTKLPFGYGLDVDEIHKLTDLADALGCSVDYLLCRTDEPGGMAAPVAAPDPEKPQWQIGTPFRSGRYCCLILCEGGKLTMNLRWNDSLLEWRMAGGGRLVCGEVVGWWPLPDKDDFEDEPEADMDALHYGEEDDEDSRREEFGDDAEE